MDFSDKGGKSNKNCKAESENHTSDQKQDLKTYQTWLHNVSQVQSINKPQEQIYFSFGLQPTSCTFQWGSPEHIRKFPKGHV